MKKNIHRIWGVGLVVVLAASLLFSAAPVSAGTLDWGTKTIPSSTGEVLTNDTEVVNFSVSADGTMYLVSGSDNYCYKSTNNGITWSQLSEDFETQPTFVAVAYDDADVLAVADATDVWISTNGGSTWGSLGRVYTTTSNVSAITDLAVSSDDGGKNYIGIAGQNTSTLADVWYFDRGASAPKWHSTRTDTGFDVSMVKSYAVEFSPNIASDKVMVAVAATTTNTTYQMYSLNTNTWNSPFGSGYPVALQNGSTAVAGTASAAIALSPEYLGSDDSMRVAYVGLNTGSTDDNAGVYRLKDDSDKAIKDDVNINSVTFDGTNLVAGATDDNKVYRSDNPLATDPDFSTTSSLKRPGTVGTTKVIVAWNGSDVVAGTSGIGSAFSVSRDNGKSFSDISFIDVSSTLENLGLVKDVAVSADGSVIYLLTSDNYSLSLYRNASSWERVLALGDDYTSDYIVRVAPEDADAVYVVKKASKTVYYSQEGGDTKWFTRTAKYNIGDMAVESAEVAYIGVDSAKTVSKTTNSGFTWGTAQDTGLTGGNINMVRSLGEDEVIIGSEQGYVAWSSDGNDSWDKVKTKLDSASYVQVTASGLDDGDYIYAATASADTLVQRWEIGQSGTGWKDLSAPSTDLTAYGIALADGVLYVQTTVNATVGSYTLRTLSPTTSEPSEGMWSTMYKSDQLFDATPQSLKVSEGSLWSVDSATAALYVYSDTLVSVGPTLLSPADGFTDNINRVSGYPYDIAFTWERPSKAKIYDLRVAQDSSFTETIYKATTSSTTDAEISEVASGTEFMPGTTYYWRVRVNIAGPVKSPWSETRTFTVGELPEAQAPVIIEQPPAPVIQVPPQAPITIQPPEIVLPAPQAVPEIVIPAPPAAPAPITPAYIWAIIIIGAILVIAVVVLIVRTRRPV